MTHYAMVIDMATCVGCNACMAACSLENQTPVWADHWRTKVHDREIGDGTGVQRRFIPRLCNHCDNPPCMSVCPSGATHKTEEGVVLVETELCMGCGACAMACPYDARYPATQDDIEKGREYYGRLHRKTPSMDKCSFCHHRLMAGGEPACVQTCVGYARIFGDLDDPESPITALVRSGKARPLMAHLGTRPNVYYIPEK
ncbi:MAG: 4Fe-4S dicluster domain-containing protein [Magnetococcales bacterium]|nr:4Fe-4S dicluster domain-containing protein [Magnetococcales bacterium]